MSPSFLKQQKQKGVIQIELGDEKIPLQKDNNQTRPGQTRIVKPANSIKLRGKTTLKAIDAV